MRYFRYKRTGKVYTIARKKEIARLPKVEQRKHRKNDVLQVLGVIQFFLISGLCTGVGINLLLLIPKPENVLLFILYCVALVVATVIILAFSMSLGVMLAGPIFNKTEDVELIIGKTSASQACDHLRRYYGLQEPFIVTKCFDCTNENFKNHDVCLFVCGEELRITADLLRGFVNGEKDLGCYAFRADEISLIKQEKDGRLALEMKAGNIVFLLGYRAKGFIKKYYLSPQE